MDHPLTFIATTLLTIAVFLYIVSRILHRNPAMKTEELKQLIRTEFARAKRLKRNIAVIVILFEENIKTDLVRLLTGDRSLIRDYDHISLLGKNKYILLWCDHSPEVKTDVIKTIIQSRLTGIRGIKHIGVALYPEHSESYEELIQIAENS